MSGLRIHLADIEQHNGTRNEAGLPTYEIDDDWTTVVEEWPCQIRTSAETEATRGRQTTSQSTHIFTGDSLAIERIGVDTTCRLVVNSRKFDIVGVFGISGIDLEAEIHAKVEE